MGKFIRNYKPCFTAIKEQAGKIKNKKNLLRAVIEILWSNLKDKQVSWLGFYLINDSGNAMVLSYCKPKPACSPIALNGVCGRAWVTGKIQIIPDVHKLGTNHIVCDPKNNSELVIPMFDRDGTCYGVLDLDSYEKNAFSKSDSNAIEKILTISGLTRKMRLKR